MINIATHLQRMAAEQPDAPAVISAKGLVPSTGGANLPRYSFRELDELSDRIAANLHRHGIVRGTKVALLVPPSLDFFALTFALFKAGTIPVLIDPGIGIKSLKTCIEEAAPEVFIGIPKAQIARILFGWGKKSIKTVVTVGSRPLFSGITLKDLMQKEGIDEFKTELFPPDQTAAILFTSGSTGVPKGAVYTHRIFTTQVEQLKSLYGIEPGEIDLCTFPLFALFAPALGMTAVIPDMDATRPGSVDPKKIFAPIEAFGVTNMFGSPALINRISRAANAPQLSTLRRVISAGAPVPASTLRRFNALLPETTEIHTPYGATESLPVTTIGSHEILDETAAQTDLGKGICVGRAVKGLRIEIIPISDEPIERWNDDLPLPAGTIGEIVVQGPQVTASYHERPESTRLAKIADPVNVSFFHRMGDLGYLDDRGRIWFCGRKAHRVETAEGPLYTIQVEGVFNPHPAVFRTALVGVGPYGTQLPILCVELEKGISVTVADRERFERELREIGKQHPHTAAINYFLFHTGFPVDIRHNAKIFREKLAIWAARQLRIDPVLGGTPPV